MSADKGPQGNISYPCEAGHINARQQGQESVIYQKLEVKPGDIITSVNGEAVDSPAKALELYNKMRSLDSVGVKFNLPAWVDHIARCNHAASVHPTRM